MRYACLWAAAALALGIIAAGLAAMEPSPGTWTWLGYVRLCSTGLLTAPIVSVLGARRPGDKAWNLIVMSLLVVFTLPVLVQWLLGRSIEVGRVGMDGPSATFFLVIVAVGIVNYAVTRFGIGCVFCTFGLVLQISAIGPWDTGDAVARGVYFAGAGIMASAGGWIAYLSSPRDDPRELTRRWERLRDGWGLLWSARVRERWHASARHYGWPIRLNWFGPPITCDPATTPDQFAAAEREFNRLARRFLESVQDEPWNESATEQPPHS
jgi:hypothetical protein